MIKKAIDIMQKNLIKVNVLNGGKSIKEIFKEKYIECFIVYEEGELAGIITKNELIEAHPNRIAADIMSHKYTVVNYNILIWEIKEVFDLNKDIDIILVKKENDIVGYISRIILEIELSKYIDVLTGLYRNEYMFYNAYKFIRKEKYLTIVFIDLNNFGYINKRYGHIIGDKILQGVANILKRYMEQNICLCRYAGDEFALVTSYSIEEGRVIAKKIIKDIREYEFIDNIQVSAAIGITGCIIQNESIKNISEFLSKMVNTASIASTKAKKVDDLIVIEDLFIDEIA